MRYRFNTFLILFLLISANLISQGTKLEVVCFVESMDANAIIGAKAELYENGSKINTINTDTKGKISFNLDYNKTYKILISKNGMIQKRIDFNTNVAAEEQRSLKKEFAMTLVEDCDGADVSVFKEPVDIITYDKGFGNFVSDKGHFEKMQSRFASAYTSLERCKDDKFNAVKTQADQQFNQGNYEEAIKLYEEALTVYPNDGATKRQISQAQKNIQKDQAVDQRYDQIINEADQLLIQNNLTGAKARYSEAQKLKPGDAYPQQKLTEINNTIAQQQAELAQQQQLDTEYNSLIKQGNSAMAAKNYPLAQQMFKQASDLKPNDALSNQKVAEAQNALIMQQKAEADAERINSEYSSLMAQASSAMQQGNYIEAQEHYQAAVALKPSEALPRQKIIEAQKLEAQKQKNLLAQQKAEVDAKYNNAISSATSLIAQKQYSEAITALEQALAIKPTDKYAQQQIVKVNNLIVEEAQAEQAAIEQQYNQSMALGDSKKLNKEYEAAIAAYQQALLVKTSDPLATSKLAESKSLLADKKRFEKEETENRARYMEFVQQGDSYFSSQDYVNSKANYQKALGLYPVEQYPRNQVTKIDNILAKSKKEAEYNGIIAEADGLFEQKSWEEAKVKYGQAQVVLPENNYPRQKINEINQEISSEAKSVVEKEFNDLVTKAEQQVTTKNYSEAKTIYAEAMKVMPEKSYPQQRINEINQMIDNMANQAKLDNYNQVIAEADGLFGQKKWEEAKSKYGQAQVIMPENNYPKQRINEINQNISNDTKSVVEEQYNNIVSKAEQQVTAKNYSEAKTIYAEAMKVMPEKAYPQQRINEINQMIDNMANQAKVDNYNQVVAEADRYFNTKDYTQAKTTYARALQLMPGETYPQTRINEINQITSDNARQKVVDEYNAVVAQADQNFDQKQYSQASQSYRKALAIMPDQAYPQLRLNEISSLLTEQAKKDADNSALEVRYNQIIVLADKYMADKNFPLAIAEYRNAMGVKPGEQYPSQQIDKINQQIAASQQLESERLEREKLFAQNIARADELFKSREYSNASNAYTEALIYKPGDAHATSQIQRINNIMNEAAAADEKKTQKQSQYNSLISGGDNHYNSKKFKEARESYYAALEIIPGQEYPRTQIRKIDEKLRIIAANQARSKPVTTTTATVKPVVTAASTSATAVELKNNKFTSNSERKKYLDELKGKYGSGVTKEIYKDKSSTINRYIVIRNGEVNEFREIRFKWGGAQYTVNGKPTNSFYLNSQVKARDGESFTEIDK